MARGDVKNNSPIIYVLFIVTVYALWSLAAAAYTADDCGGDKFNEAKSWQLFPPGWDCKYR